MKLQIFQSDKGDCLLLESRDGHRILCDGGMYTAMKKHVRDILGELHESGGTIDYVYVSHIDQDHISGVLQLLRDELDWRVFDFHHENGTPTKAPKVPRPPEITGGIWHNSFFDQVEKNTGKIADMLAASAPVLLATGVPELREIGEEVYNIATSIPEAIEVSKLVSPKILGIPLNILPGADGPGKLLMVRDENESFQVGSMTLTIVGPAEEELKNLRDGWNNYLNANATVVKEIEKKLKKRMGDFGSQTLGDVDLKWFGVDDFKGVTPPNVASLMFMVEEDGQRLLLTGDSQQDIILKGLELTGFLDDGYLHLDVLKVQHHASENNLDPNFARRVSADHYVFCGNGEHKNPDLRVVKDIYNSRLGPATKRALAPEAEDRPFKMWFSTAASVGSGPGEAQAHMEDLEAFVDGLVQSSGGKMTAVFNDQAFITLTL